MLVEVSLVPASSLVVVVGHPVVLGLALIMLDWIGSLLLACLYVVDKSGKKGEGESVIAEIAVFHGCLDQLGIKCRPWNKHTWTSTALSLVVWQQQHQQQPY